MSESPSQPRESPPRITGYVQTLQAQIQMTGSWCDVTQYDRPSFTSLASLTVSSSAYRLEKSFVQKKICISYNFELGVSRDSRGPRTSGPDHNQCHHQQQQESANPFIHAASHHSGEDPPYWVILGSLGQSSVLARSSCTVRPARLWDRPHGWLTSKRD